jgi:nucleotide-binding universal stress UspA family protein
MYSSILVPLDGSPFAEQALPLAVSIATASRAKLTIVRAWDPSNYRFSSELTPPFLDAEAHDRMVATEYLDAVGGRLRTTSGVTVSAAVIAGRPVDAIHECATNVAADLVVMTTHGLTGWSRAWLGSVADAVVRTVAIPVLLCRPTETAAPMPSPLFSRVVIALDGSPAAEEILPHAAELGRMGGASFTLVRVAPRVMMPVHPYTYAAPAWQIDQAALEEAVSHAHDYLNATAESLKARYPGSTIAVDVRLDERPGMAIVDAVQDHKADLVALTTHARRGVRLVLGSVADKVLRGTDGAVLVLRPAGGSGTPDA